MSQKTQKKVSYSGLVKLSLILRVKANCKLKVNYLMVSIQKD